MDDKAEDFAEGLFGDIFASFAEAMELDIQDSGDREGRRCSPVEFHADIVTFSKGIIDKLLPDMTNMPVLLCDNEDFFMRFTKSVCLKLAHNEDPEVGFLKATAFLTAFTAMSFLIRCYRSALDIPLVLRKLLQEHIIKTRFYEKNGFDGISLRCRNLKADKQWCQSTVEEIRGHMKDSLETELAATTFYHPFEPDRTKITILHVRSQARISTNPDSNVCPYCGMACFKICLKEFYKPRIRYKPGFEPI